tara:strand:+ start:8583 stop:8777 length:195 start_codon:yes stop_codon:yes gene_type:complete
MAYDDRGELDLTKQIDTLKESRDRFKMLFMEVSYLLHREKKKIKRYRRFVKFLEGGVRDRKTNN